MNARPLVIITTRLPPAICGIGTYSWLLRRHWPNESNLVQFLVVDRAAGNGTSEMGDRVGVFNNNAADLARELERIGSADVVLHYAGRAYHPFGFPLWLPRVLANWKQRFVGARLSVFVHELPGPLPVTSRHFWLGELNKLVVLRLGRIADVFITNTEHHAGVLRRITGRDDVALIPVGSNIEPPVRIEGEVRKGTECVLFGLPFGRLQTLRLLASKVDEWIAAGRLTKLHLIGPNGDSFSAQADELLQGSREITVRHGLIAPSEISQLLRQAGFALTNASEETWSKSTTFMACAAHGCAAVIAGARSKTPPLCHAVTADEVPTIPDLEVQTRSAELAAWYQQNADWRVTAAKVAALCARQGAAA